LIDSIPFPIFYKNSDGKYLGCNSELQSFLGLEENIVGKESKEIMEGAFSKEQIKFLEKKDKELFKSSDVSTYEVDIKNKDKTLHFIVSKTLLREQQGHVELAVGAIVDISEIKKTQTELEATREKLNTILDSMKEVILKYDKDFKVIWANREAYETLGKNKKEIVGKYCYELWFNAKKPCKECPIILAKRTKRKLEGIIKPFNGFFYEACGYPVIEKDGSISGIVEVALDVTEREKAKQESKMRQEQLFHADKMRALGSIVSGVAHEINNPANYIMINISVMKRIWMDLLPMISEKINEIEKIGGLTQKDLKKNMPELLNGIDDGAERIRRTVEHLKDYARETPTDMSELFDVNSALFKAIELLKPLIKRSTKNFKVDYGSGIPKAKGDMRRIEQVAVNVIQNACEALDEDSKAVSVKTYFDKDANCSVIEVSDEGKGIQQENIALVTEPFFTTKRASGGTGLGLSISAGIMEEHKGRLEIISEFSKGSSVKIILPTLK
jgi:PAS domain S-box-containing protein